MKEKEKKDSTMFFVFCCFALFIWLVMRGWFGSGNSGSVQKQPRAEPQCYKLSNFKLFFFFLKREA